MTPNVVSWTNEIGILWHKDQMLQLFPTKDMTPTEKQNATVRLLALATVASYMLFKDKRIRIAILAGAVSLVMYLHGKHVQTNNNRKTNKPVLMSEKDRSLAAAHAEGIKTAEKLVEQADAKPELVSPSMRNKQRGTELALLEEKARRGQTQREADLETLMTAKEDVAAKVAGNVYEAPTRTTLVPSKDVLIYANRPFIPRSTDDFDDLMDAGLVGPEKYLSSGKINV